MVALPPPPPRSHGLAVRIAQDVPDVIIPPMRNDDAGDKIVLQHRQTIDNHTSPTISSMSNPSFYRKSLEGVALSCQEFHRRFEESVRVLEDWKETKDVTSNSGGERSSDSQHSHSNHVWRHQQSQQKKNTCGPLITDPGPLATNSGETKTGLTSASIDAWYQRQEQQERQQIKENRLVGHVRTHLSGYQLCLAKKSCPDWYNLYESCWKHTTSQMDSQMVNSLHRDGMSKVICRPEREAVERCMGRFLSNVALEEAASAASSSPSSSFVPGAGGHQHRSNYDNDDTDVF